MGELVEVDGCDLAIRQSGDGPAVLLIHGTAPATWGDLEARLAPARRVIAYDRRSFGDSPAPPPGDLRVHADDAATLLERLEAGPALIIGWSIGGVIALDLACRHPERVGGLLLLEPPFRAKRHPNLAMLRAIGGATVLGRLGRADAGAERFLRWALGRRDGTSDLERVDGWRRSSAAIVAELGAGTGEHLDRRALAELAVPTTVVIGTESDPAFAAAGRRVASLVPHARLITAESSGHLPQLDAPGLLTQEVEMLTPAATVADQPPRA